MKRRWLTIIAGVVLTACVCTLHPSPSTAGDVEDSIKEAEKLYKKGDYNETIKELKTSFPLPFQGGKEKRRKSPFRARRFSAAGSRQAVSTRGKTRK
jgi:hypothetical protein